jgi:hypothetical protein
MRTSQAMASSLPPPKARPLTGGDRGHALLAQRLEQRVRAVEQLAATGLVHRRERLDVGAGREQQRVGRGDHERPDAALAHLVPDASRSAITWGAMEFIWPLASHAIATSPRVSSLITSVGGAESSGSGWG